MKFFFLSYSESQKEIVKAKEFAQSIEDASMIKHPYDSMRWACCNSWIPLGDDGYSDVNIKDLQRANAFVMLSDFNYSYSSRIEYGMALALKLPTYIVRDPRQPIEDPYFDRASLIVSEYLFLQHPFLNFDGYLPNSPPIWEVASSVPVWHNSSKEIMIYEVQNQNLEKHWRVKRIEDPHNVYVPFSSFKEAREYHQAISKVDEAQV